MIQATIYPLLTSFLGDGVEVSMNFAGPSPQVPYCTWRLLTANPDINLDQPPSDDHNITVDVFSHDEEEASALIVKARNAIESIGDVETIQSLGYDPVPKLWRWTLQGSIPLNR